MRRRRSAAIAARRSVLLRTATTGPNPDASCSNDNNPNIPHQKAIFGEGSYKLTPTLKLTADCASTNSDISNQANQRGLGTASEMPRPP